MHFPNPYEKPYYKFYILIAAAVFIAAAIQLPNLKPGIDLTGGTAMTMPIDRDVSSNELKSFVLSKGVEDASVKLTSNPLTGRRGIIIEFTGHTDILAARALVASDPAQARALVSQFVTNETGNLTDAQYIQLADENFKAQLREDVAAYLGISPSEISVTSIGSSIGRVFWETSERALIMAFVLIAIIVFILFRQPVPSVAVLQAIVFDVVVALAGMTLLGIPVTLPSIVALLMILGYSVDSDIMLTDRILRRTQGSSAERAFSALRTGLTMTGTTLTVLAVLMVFSSFSQMTTLFQITAVLFFGLLGDLPATYLVNVVIVKWWVDRKQES